MGAWGTHSYESDHCMDLLGEHGIDELGERRPTQPTVARCLAKLFCDEFVEDQLDGPLPTDYNMSYEWDPRLGIVVWFLSKDIHVPTYFLEKAKEIAEHLSRCESYLDLWNDPEDRMLKLGEEIEQINAALAGEETGRHIPGLIERVDDNTSEDKIADRVISDILG